MMNLHLFDSIPFQPDPDALLRRVRLRPGTARAGEFLHLLEEAGPLARPRAFYQLASITALGEDWVELDGVRFASRVLRVNLEPIYRVFPYLATCGPELQQWAAAMDDMLLSFWAETIEEAALWNALNTVQESMRELYQVGHTASMNPGSLEDWPIQQQQVLFGLFGPPAAQIGVQLTETMLMLPTKTVSGIRFETEADFESCQLCPREGCPGRRAGYDPDLYDRRYDLHAPG
jgi:hypothetical protein